MVKIPPSKIDEELAQQDDDVYGTRYTDGDHDKFDDTKEMVKDVTGNEPDPERDGFEIAEEIEEDEKDIATGRPEDASEKEATEIESEIEKIERKEHQKEDASDL